MNEATPSRRGVIAVVGAGLLTLLGQGTAKGGTKSRPAATRKVVFDLEPGWEFDVPLFHGLGTELLVTQVWIYSDGYLWNDTWGAVPFGNLVQILGADHVALHDQFGDFANFTSSPVRIVVMG